MGLIGTVNRMDFSAGTELYADRREVIRYLGYGRVTPDAEVERLIDEAVAEALPVLSPSSVLSVFDVKYTDDEIDLGFKRTASKDLRKNLRGSEHVILLAATIGAKFDMLLQRRSRRRPLEGLVMQAVGAMFIESYLDDLSGRLKAEALADGMILRPRYSPGFGDLGLELQTDIFKTLNCTRIGLTLNSSLLMSPSKSVTALIGLLDDRDSLLSVPVTGAGQTAK